MKYITSFIVRLLMKKQRKTKFCSTNHLFKTSLIPAFLNISWISNFLDPMS